MMVDDTLQVSPAADTGKDTGGTARSTLCPIVMACDENFAMPLATALRSLVDANRRHWPIEVTVLTDGFSDVAKQRVLDSLPRGSARMNWVLIELSEYAQFTPMAYLSHMTYARFQIERHFGPEVRRVLYVDADMLVLEDLGPLAATELNGHPIAAVPDFHIDGALRRGVVPDPGGLPDLDRYFNAGLLLIDLHEWRRQRIAARALAFLKENPKTPYADQDALNVACRNAWLELPVRWNYQDHLRTRMDSLVGAMRPAVVHFITGAKPWKPQSLSVNASFYAAYRDRTVFRRSMAQRLSDRLVAFRTRCRNKLGRIRHSLLGS